MSGAPLQRGLPKLGRQKKPRQNSTLEEEQRSETGTIEGREATAAALVRNFLTITSLSSEQQP